MQFVAAAPGADETASPQGLVEMRPTTFIA
jgi:hypothetical protein